MFPFPISSSAAGLSFGQGRRQPLSVCLLCFFPLYLCPCTSNLSASCPDQKTWFPDLHFLLPTIFPLPCIHSFHLLSLPFGFALSRLHLGLDLLPPCSAIFYDFIGRCVKLWLRCSHHHLPPACRSQHCCQWFN